MLLASDAVDGYHRHVLYYTNIIFIGYREILDIVQKEGQTLQEALPFQSTVTNVVQQVLHVIREEYRVAIAKVNKNRNNKYLTLLALQIFNI